MDEVDDGDDPKANKDETSVGFGLKRSSFVAEALLSESQSGVVGFCFDHTARASLRAASPE